MSDDLQKKRIEELRAENRRMYDELRRALETLNKIAMLGCGELAYTSMFTEKVNGLARTFLSSIKDKK